MRRGTIIFLVINLAIIGFLVHACSSLISLLFVTGEADAILRAEIPSPGSNLTDNGTQLIPKIIHQTYINDSIPARWKEGQQRCVDLHDDYEYILWTDEKSRDFIATEYPWALDNFDSYKFPIQRADAIRYFVLAHYGGIYIDLDDGCNRRLDPLLSYPAWYKGYPSSFFNVTKGNSWHGKDAQTIFWMGKHWLLLTVVGFSTAFVVGAVLWWLWNACLLKGKRTSGGRSGMGLWRRISGKDRYELLDRMA
ncbi:hypothetical protein BUE80_DR012235 [Diplocarpon rosae]|nr:hypothetical protein BUE80_DR012235 [Diplocarpon rosae]